MIPVFKTRLIHWRKQLFSLIFWLVLPIIATLAVIYFTDRIQEDSKIPVGIVMEEDTVLANDLYEEINRNPLIRVYDVTEREARIKVESHELDSAFVIQGNYEENIMDGKRNRLITSYKSDLSFAYLPVSELIISHVQQETGRAKAALTVMNLSDNTEESWTQEEIIAKTKEIGEKENLLVTSFSFIATNPSGNEGEIRIWNNWTLWAIFSMLATLLLTDWVIKERKPAIRLRYAFMKFSLKNYLLQNLFLYMAVFFTMDLFAVFAFYAVLDEPISMQLVLSLMVFRVTVSLGAFLFALPFKNIYFYYVVSFVITLVISLLTGVIFPVDGMITVLNPLYSFSQQSLLNPWLFIFVIIVALWLMKGERLDA